jgi:hypothetical protein
VTTSLLVGAVAVSGTRRRSDDDVAGRTDNNGDHVRPGQGWQIVLVLHDDDLPRRLPVLRRLQDTTRRNAGDSGACGNRGFVRRRRPPMKLNSTVGTGTIAALTLLGRG